MGGVNALKLTRRDDPLAAAPAETARDETDQVSDAGGEPAGREHGGEVELETSAGPYDSDRLEQTGRRLRGGVE